jgi:hypothetical protein
MNAVQRPVSFKRQSGASVSCARARSVTVRADLNELGAVAHQPPRGGSLRLATALVPRPGPFQAL